VVIIKKIFIIILLILFSIQIANAQKCEKFIGSKCSELKWEKSEVKSGEVAEILGGLSDECARTPWPPDCSFIPDPIGRSICEKCKIS